MPRLFPILLLTASFCLQAQKPTLTDLDNGQKQAAEAAQAAQKQAAQKQAESSTSQHEILVQQAAAARLAALGRDNAALAQYKQELRLEAIESSLAEANAAKQANERETKANAKKDHDDLMLTIREIGVGLAVPLLLGIVRILKNMRVIHGLVNSNMTASMQGEYNALVATAIALRELAEEKPAVGERRTELNAQILAVDARIAELRAQLADRLKATSR